jgi:hypothetical protein
MMTGSPLGTAVGYMIAAHKPELGNVVVLGARVFQARADTYWL